MPLDVNPIKDAPSIKQCSMGVMWSTGLRLVGDTGIATCCGSCMGWGVSSPFFFTLGACQRATATEGPHVSFYSRTTTVRSGRDTNSAAEGALPSAPHGRFPQAAKWRRRRRLRLRGGGAAARPQRSCYPTPPSAPLPALPAGRSAGPRPTPFTPPPEESGGAGVRESVPPSSSSRRRLGPVPLLPELLGARA